MILISETMVNVFSPHQQYIMIIITEKSLLNEEPTELPKLILSKLINTKSCTEEKVKKQK